MSHDHLCPVSDGQLWCECTLITRVREDEFTHRVTAANLAYDYALIDAMEIIKDRIEDLTSCHKDDDCKVIAQGAELALADIEDNLVTDDGGDQ